MASTDKELEEQLLEAGSKLVDPPSSVDELLPLLDQIESCLSRVEQSPTKSMQNTLSPSLKALISDNLLRHSDDDVKVSVASCITEITRITAPDAPYDDEQMKEVFQLIVSSFENLYDKSSRSYAKRTSILETVAKVRSCVVMLDLECDALILEMFQHFFKAVREHHSEDVLSSMETIMTLVIEESEDISVDLLSPILASLKKDNEDVSPNAQNLGERVVESCASKLRPYLLQAVTTLGIFLDDYSKVLASICQETSGCLDQNDVCASSENVAAEDKSAKATLDELTQVVEEDAKKATSSQQVTVVGGRPPKPFISNGIVQSSEDDLLEDSKSLKKQDVNNSDCQDVNILSNEDPNDVNIKKVEQAATKRRGRLSSTKLVESSEASAVAHDRDAEKMLDSKCNSKDLTSSPHENHSTEVARPAENDKENYAKFSSEKTGNNESGVLASPSSGSYPDENRSKKPGRPNKREKAAKEEVISSEDVAKKVSEVTSDSDAKPTKRSAKKASGGISDGKKTIVVNSIKTSGSTSDEGGKRQSVKKVDETNKGAGSSLRQLKERKRRNHGKVSDLDVTKPAKDEEKEIASSPKSGTRLIKDEQHSEEALKTNLKRKRTPGKENKSAIKEYGENLVGSRVKVWWPEDHAFYNGIIGSFDSTKKKHKVMYDDGDEETLNLRKEKWEFDEEEGDDHTSPETSADTPSNKKGKTSADESTKGKNMDTFSKSGRTSSRKSKGSSMKSGHKLKDGSKVDRKSKDSKSIDKSEDSVGRKAKDHVSKSGSDKSVDAALKTTQSKNINTPKSSKSKNDDISKPKFSSKSKKETPKKSKQEDFNTPASKGKPPKSGGKSNVNAAGKVKSGSSKTKDAKSEFSADSSEEVGDTMDKVSSSFKAQGSSTKAGKKRRRG